MEELTNPSRRRLFSRKPISAKHLRLPWVKSEALFIDKCTKCQQCITVCDTQIITPDANGFPRIDFSDGECTFCNKCIETCEQPMFVSTKQRINALSEVTKAEISTSNNHDISKNNTKNNDFIQPWPATLTLDTQSASSSCLASNNVFCQSCKDECEVEAISFSYVKTDENGEQQISAIAQPAINNNDCTQCGACISNCPQDAINLTVSDFSYQR